MPFGKHIQTITILFFGVILVLSGTKPSNFVADSSKMPTEMSRENETLTLFDAGPPTESETFRPANNDVKRQIYENDLFDISDDLESPTEIDEKNGSEKSQKGLPGRCVVMTCHFSNQELDQVPLNLPPNITGLDLSNNKISSLPRQSLCTYPNLQFLTLELNKLAHGLYNDSFECMSKLVYLNLRGNRKLALPQGVFKPMTSLLFLKFNRIWRANLAYPEEELVHLKKLLVLYIDGLPNATFGHRFREMTSLRTLILTGNIEGHCDLKDLRNNSFDNLSQLRFLNISDCQISGKHFPANLFQSLKKLHVLDLTYNKLLKMDNLRRALWGLRNSSLSALLVNNVISRFSLGVTVRPSHVENLPASLTYLEARENSFESIEANVLDRLPSGLRYLDLGNNKFVYGKYLLNLTSLRNLQVLKLNSGGFLYNFPSPSLPHLQRPRPQSFPLLRGHDGDEDLVFNIPPRLSHFEMKVGGLHYILTQLYVNENNSLRYVDVGENYFPQIRGPFTGLQQLEYLDLSMSFVEHFGRDYFKNFPSLKSLFLDNNLLNKFLNTVYPGNATLLGYLRNLTFLQLSYNRITTLPYNVFEGLDKLEYLYLDGNLMRNFDVGISHMKSLALLSMHSGGFTTLPDHVRRHIDSLGGVFVDLASNPIHCDCHNIDFLRWMVKSKAFDETFQNYSCVYPDSSSKYIHDAYEQDLRLLEKQCAQNYAIFLAVTGATLLTLSAITFGIVYRFRWKLRFWYYTVHVWLRSKQPEEAHDTYRYDVFVSYTFKDESFVISELIPELRKRGLRLHVHGRDFVAGDFIASNIVTAVKESRKTLVVLTRNLLASTWCNYELQMANMESVHTGRQVLVFLLKESISTRELGSELTYHIRNSTYIMDPRSEGVVEEAVVDQFWNKLASDLRH